MTEMYHHGDKKSKYWTVGPSPHIIGQTTTPSWHRPVKQETQTLSMYTATITQDPSSYSSSPLTDMCGKEEEESESSASILINSEVELLFDYKTLSRTREVAMSSSPPLTDGQVVG